MPLSHQYSSTRVINVLDYYDGPLSPNPFTSTTPSFFEEADATSMINAALSDLDIYLGYGNVPGPSKPLTVGIPYQFVLYFPPGTYRINSPIITNFTGLHIIGDGALILPTEDSEFLDDNNEEDFAFQHLDCYAVKMEGMNFAGFKKAVRLSTLGGESGMLQLHNCSFQNNSIVALELDANSAAFNIENCKFMNNKLSIDNLAGGISVIIKQCWIYGGAEGLDGVNSSFIVNRSNMLIDACTLVPSQPVETSIEPAWINNYGHLTIKDTRQGGEYGGFTLINNYTYLGNLYGNSSEITGVIVENCQCYAQWTSNNTDVNPPAILRYVEGIPNLTVIEHNRGVKLPAAILGFSVNAGLTDSAAINAMILASAGGSSELLNSFNICVHVANNAGGKGWAPQGSIIPSELHPFVREKSSLWPAPGNALVRLNPWLNYASPAMPVNDPSLVDSNGKRLFKFEYPADLNQSFLINFSGSPLGGYRGGFVGILKANGRILVGTLAYTLKLEPLFNHLMDTDVLEVDAYWEATDNADIYYDYPNEEVEGGNRNFVIRIGGTDGYYDNIVVSPIDNFIS